MVNLTVRDLLKLIPSERLRVIAGQAGLDRPARWATAMRAIPPYLSHVAGGELVLLLGPALRSTSRSVSLPQLIETLAEQGAVAAITDQLSTDAIEVADRHGLPLLLTSSSQAAEFESEINRVIGDRLNYLYTVSTSAGHRFAELAAAGGQAAILEHAATLLGDTVIWDDQHFVTLMAVPPAGESLSFPPPLPPVDLVFDLRSGQHGDGVPVVELPPGPDGYRRLITPIVAGGTLRGYLSAVHREGEFSDVARATLQRAAEACALELLRAPSQRKEASPAIESLLREVLLGTYGSDTVVTSRARYLGLDLEAPHLVGVLELTGPAQDDPRLHAEALRLFDVELRSRAADTMIVRELEPLAVLLTPGAGPALKDRERLVRALGEIVRRANQRLDTGHCIVLGLGGTHPGLPGYARAYEEARYAARVGPALGFDPLVDFTALGFYQLLFPLQATEELTEFRDATVGPLLQYDRRRRSDMIATLDAYFQSGCNVIDAADRLHVHRNSLAYRLRRITDITGRDLHDQEQLFLLQLALRIHKVLEAVQPLKA